MYDFGCLKRVPERIAVGYARLFLAAIDGDHDAMPEMLAEIGLTRADGSPLALELVEPYLELFGEILREAPPYRFGEDEDLYERVMELGMANWSQATDMRFPEDIIFIDRTLAGHFGNLVRFDATGPWREILAGYAREVISDE